MAKTVTNGNEPFDVLIQVLGLGQKPLAVNLKPTIRRKGRANLFKGKAGEPAQGDPGAINSNCSRTLESKSLRKPFLPVD